VRQANVNLSRYPGSLRESGTYDLTIFDGFVPPILAGKFSLLNRRQGKYLSGQSGQEIGRQSHQFGQDAHNLLTGC